MKVVDYWTEPLNVGRYKKSVNFLVQLFALLEYCVLNDLPMGVRKSYRFF